MSINKSKIVSWFDNHKGRLTYSMYGSRNGADGTADCSGSITQAVYEAGGSKPAYLYSTTTLGSYLAANGFKRISQNQSWDAQQGDIVLMSWGANMASSGGAGGHVGVMKDANTFISTDYWTGGTAGTAVSEHNYNGYYANSRPSYIEVWRYTGKEPNKAPAKHDKPKGAIGQFMINGNQFTAFKPFTLDKIAFVNGMWQGISYKLAGSKTDWDWTLNGIPLAILDNKTRGNQADSHVGDKFTFMKGYNEGTIDEYDQKSNGVGIIMGGYGMIWFDANALLDL